MSEPYSTTLRFKSIIPAPGWRVLECSILLPSTKLYFKDCPVAGWGIVSYEPKSAGAPIERDSVELLVKLDRRSDALPLSTLPTNLDPVMATYREFPPGVEITEKDKRQMAEYLNRAAERAAKKWAELNGINTKLQVDLTEDDPAEDLGLATLLDAESLSIEGRHVARLTWESEDQTKVIREDVENSVAEGTRLNEIVKLLGLKKRKRYKLMAGMVAKKSIRVAL